MAQTYIQPAAPVAQAPVIFVGTPSQVVNLGAYLRCALILLILGIIFVVLRTREPQWAWTPLLPALIVLVVMAAVYVRLKFVELTIDEERITLRQGILNKKTLSLELFRIQDVTAFLPWWQRAFGVGTVVVESSDTTYPRLGLYGIHQPEVLRDRLNRAAIALRDRKGIREVNMGRV